VKVWYVADSASKFVYKFDIYCGKDLNIPEGQARARNGEGNMVRNVVLGLMVGLEGKAMYWFVITIFQASGYSWSCMIVTFMGRGQCTLIVWDYHLSCRICACGMGWSKGP
jgi:hypothetical protein